MKVTEIFASPLLHLFGVKDNTVSPHLIAAYIRDIVLEFEDDEDIEDELIRTLINIVDVRKENGAELRRDSINYYVTIQFRDTDDYYQFLINDNGRIDGVTLMDYIYPVEKKVTITYEK